MMSSNRSHKTYRPTLENTIPMVILKPTVTNVSGVTKKVYPTINEAVETTENIFYGSFKTYGGTETNINGVYHIVDTANVECWYRPDIESDCRVGIIDAKAVYEIINEPENIDMRNQFLKFKLRRVLGKI